MAREKSKRVLLQLVIGADMGRRYNEGVNVEERLV